MKEDINNFKSVLKAYFTQHNVSIVFMGEKDNPLIVDSSTGEALYCSFSRDNSGVVFGFNNNIKKFYISFVDLLDDSRFNFNHWYKTSTKKKIYIFQSENQYFQRYNVKEQEFVPIFTPELDRSYFVFRLEKALLFQRKMNQNGIILKIIRQWEDQKRIC
ncbi:hypothetical protein NZD88_20815 [Chryseobacterium antibioticum]|uniref:Immunity protein 63 domain-containing protein n=1 Tax=Chryseobacterium pyrolae TaxID=2987481 RepID=A0ABT2IMW1_9FLAO|nr:hypothetical protein [Chryseobacterium pyrolae]MCT2410005.1 hypothetical protein [Chryseobacterium pyrolae]